MSDGDESRTTEATNETKNRQDDPVNGTTQTILALGLVFAALGFLLWRWLRRRGGACDAAGCDCARGALRKPRK